MYIHNETYGKVHIKNPINKGLEYILLPGEAMEISDIEYRAIKTYVITFGLSVHQSNPEVLVPPVVIPVVQIPESEDVIEEDTCRVEEVKEVDVKSMEAEIKEIVSEKKPEKDRLKDKNYFLSLDLDNLERILHDLTKREIIEISDSYKLGQARTKIDYVDLLLALREKD